MLSRKKVLSGGFCHADKSSWQAMLLFQIHDLRSVCFACFHTALQRVGRSNGIIIVIYLTSCQSAADVAFLGKLMNLLSKCLKVGHTICGDSLLSYENKIF